MTQIGTSSEEGGHASVLSCRTGGNVTTNSYGDNQVEKSACVGPTVTSNTDLGHISGTSREAEDSENTCNLKIFASTSDSTEHIHGGELVEKSTSVMHATTSNNEPTSQEPANDPAAVDTTVATPSPTIDPPSNVIVFGESGVGKSSVINMLMGEPVAAVSNEAVGCTYKSNKFRTTIDGREVMLYDTAGLDEAEAGTVSPERAIQNLRSLVKDLKTVNLLVYCIRGIRFRTIVADNYKMFRNTICGSDRKVPIVLVITGLENEDNMDDWWENNKEYFDQYNLKFCGHACITATKGRAFKDQQGYIFEDLYKDSKEKVTRLLENHAFKSSITISPPERPRYPDLHAGASDAPGIGTSLLGLFCLPVRWASDTYESIMSEAQNGE